jgi:hypothetical protein
MPALPPLPRAYSVESVRSDDGERTRLYVDGWMERIEMPDEHTIIITRPDLGVIWTLDTQARTYRQSKLPARLDEAFNPDMLDEWTQDGTEKIDGRSYLRFVGRSKNPDFGGAISEVCFLDPKTHIRRRIVTFNKSGKCVLTIDSVNAVVGPPAHELFDMPEGYKKAYRSRRPH